MVFMTSFFSFFPTSLHLLAFIFFGIKQSGKEADLSHMHRTFQELLRCVENDDLGEECVDYQTSDRSVMCHVQLHLMFQL